MKTSKQGNNARILPLKKQREIEADHEEVTAMTRSLFSETWNSYVDQASTATAAFQLEHNHKAKPVTSDGKINSLLRILK